MGRSEPDHGAALLETIAIGLGPRHRRPRGDALRLPTSLLAGRGRLAEGRGGEPEAA